MKRRVLLVGSGGREHALGWKLAQNPDVELLLCPGSDALVEMGGRKVCDFDLTQALSTARREQVGLVVVGPEQPLADGWADQLRQAGIPVFGPGRDGARLEASKSFAKQFMRDTKIPTASFVVADNPRVAIQEIDRNRNLLVVKTDGLAAGKGVIVAETSEEMKQIHVPDMFQKYPGQPQVLEEKLEGDEASLLVLTDGNEAVALASSQDHKRLEDGDQGPNTGGMGAYSPAPCLDDSHVSGVMKTVVQPLLAGLKKRNIAYRGLLYVGLMITPDGPKVLEFNCRFGDPETQAILPRLDEDLLVLLDQTAKGRLSQRVLRWTPDAVVCVVAASAGYPQAPQTGKPIEGLDAAGRMPGVRIFHGATRRQGSQWLTAGGRVLNICGRGGTIRQARDCAYAALDKIRFDGMHYRRDIARRALQNAVKSE